MTKVSGQRAEAGTDWPNVYAAILRHTWAINKPLKISEEAMPATHGQTMDKK